MDAGDGARYPQGLGGTVQTLWPPALSQVVAPAVRYAREGYPCSPNLAKFWKRGLEKYRTKVPGELFEEWSRTFCPLGRAYEAGEMIRLPHHGDTIEAIGETGADAFYHGHLADQIDA